MTLYTQKKLDLPAKMAVGLVVGAIIGTLVQYLNTTGLLTDITIANYTFSINENTFKPFGDLFIRLIRMIVVPLVFCSIVSGAASMGNASKLGKIAVRVLTYFLITTLIAVAIGLILANIMHPGKGVPLPSSVQAAVAVTPPSLIDTFLAVVPLNPIEALATGNLLQVLFFAIIFGFAISAVGEKGQKIAEFFTQMNTVMVHLTTMVMRYAPIGVGALIAFTVAKFGLAALLPLGKLIVAMYIGAVLQIIFVYMFLIKSFTKIRLKDYFRIMAEPLLLAFTTCSSAAALPANMHAARRLGATKDITSFTVPLGTTVNMDGAALYLGIASIFVADVYGITLGFQQQVTVLVMSLLASIGSVGVPGSALIVMTMVFTQVGLPMEGIALVAGIDRILDMARTTLNVMGDSTGALIISRASGKIDPEYQNELLKT